ncbi:hypothetical protein [Leptodesmis sp.]|uniref:hypothetical protein n=1 Tax=Leptodesmis sp. TaxID=3100501 RepID=UPI0040534745
MIVQQVLNRVKKLDSDSFQQAVMKAFGPPENWAITYQLMQDVVQQFLTPNQASLFCLILELKR